MDTASLVIAIATLITSIGAVVIGIRNAGRIQNVHLDLNSKLADLIVANRLVAHAEGREEARKEQIDKEANR